MTRQNLARTRLIETAADLLARQGYHATGVNQIAQESETPMGSLYYYFKQGKDELVSAAMLSGGNTITMALEQVFATSMDAPMAITMFGALLGQQLMSSSFQKGCPIATVILEEAARNDVIQRTSQTIYQGWQAQIAAFLQSKGYSEQRSREFALFSLSVIEGALILSRAERNTEPLTNACATLATMLAEAQP